MIYREIIHYTSHDPWVKTMYPLINKVQHVEYLVDSKARCLVVITVTMWWLTFTNLIKSWLKDINNWVLVR
jgi:hypothetical protein